MTVYIADTNTGYCYLLWLVTTHVVATTNTAVSKCYDPTTHFYSTSVGGEHNQGIS